MRPSTPRLTQYWKAIFRACSTATAPSAAKRKCGASTGTTCASASANSITTVLPFPSMVLWATLPSLGHQRGIELGDPVPQCVDPEGRDRIEVAPAVDIDQLASLGPVDDEGRVGGVGLHLREAVPHHGGIALDPLVSSRTCGFTR